MNVYSIAVYGKYIVSLALSLFRTFLSIAMYNVLGISINIFKRIVNKIPIIIILGDNTLMMILHCVVAYSEYIMYVYTMPLFVH